MHPPSRELGDVSGFVHPRDENCRQSQALCTPPSRKLGHVSGSVHPHNENCRQAQALSTPPHGKRGTSQAVCTPIIKSPTVSGSGHFLCSAVTKIGGRLRLCAPPDENRFLRLCAPFRTEIGGRLRLFAPPRTVYGVTRTLCFCMFLYFVFL